VFSVHRPKEADIRTQVAAAASSETFNGHSFFLESSQRKNQRPLFFAHDLSVSTIGHGELAFELAQHHFKLWTMFDLGWVRVANPEARIASGQLVAVEARTLGLWTLNVSRILATIDESCRFGFLYATTALHVEEGAERFLLDFDPQTENVTYTIEAVSRPRSTLARIGVPITRMYQSRFRKDSHRRMQGAVSRSTDTLEA
jgi:uncharacterized protein (UPF0548 family)